MNEVQLAGLFHRTYERLAPAFGYRTRKGSRVEFAALDKRHKALMIATCQTVLAALQEEEPKAASTNTTKVETLRLCKDCAFYQNELSAQECTHCSFQTNWRKASTVC